MWSRLRLAFPLVLAACVRPDENLIKIICGDGQPPCPEGKSCVAGFCAGAVDAAVTDDAATDASMTTDQASSMPDLRPVQGCASGTGVALGAMASACPGAFSAGQARQRCATGWSLCTQASKVDLAAAASLQGFFVADQPAYWSGTKDIETCGTSLGNQLLYGAGTGGRAGTAKCGGFMVVRDVETGWSTSNGSLDNAANTNAKDGVLCCR